MLTSEKGLQTKVLLLVYSVAIEASMEHLPTPLVALNRLTEEKHPIQHGDNDY